MGESFDTIAGYKEHAAIVHYSATPESDAALHPEGFLLLDSGAQYLDATTDITRTIALGSLTEEEKKDYIRSIVHFWDPYSTCHVQVPSWNQRCTS